jgi:hypothetical protein
MFHSRIPFYLTGKLSLRRTFLFGMRRIGPPSVHGDSDSLPVSDCWWYPSLSKPPPCAAVRLENAQPANHAKQRSGRFHLIGNIVAKTLSHDLARKQSKLVSLHIRPVAGRPEPFPAAAFPGREPAGFRREFEAQWLALRSNARQRGTRYRCAAPS